MIVNKSKIKFGVTDCLLFVVSVLFLIGIYFWFPVCDAMGVRVPNGSKPATFRGTLLFREIFPSVVGLAREGVEPSVV